MNIYLKSRLTRTVLGYIAALLLTAFSVFGCFYAWLIEAKEADRESAYDLPSQVVIASVNGTSTEDLHLTGISLRTFTRYKQGYEAEPVKYPDLRPYFSEVRVLVPLAYRIPDGPSVCALEGVSAGSMLSQDGITWLSGELDWEDYDAEGLLIPEELLEALPEGESNLTLTIYPSKEELQYSASCELPVAGTYTGGDRSTIYCPFELALGLMRKIDGWYGGAWSLSATVADNKKLDELRESLPRYFCQVTPSGNAGNDPLGEPYRYAAIIHDEELRETVNNLSRSISLLKRLYPIILSAEIIIAAAACWFYKHLSRREIAVARSLGMPVADILWETAAEMLILSGLSVLAAVGLAAALPVCVIDPVALAVIPASGMAGALVSAFTSAKKNGTMILKED